MKNLKTSNMKTIVYILIIIATGLVSCNDDDEATPVDSAQLKAEVTAQLSESTWNVQTVTVDRLDQNDLFEGFSLSFGDGTFTSQNGGEVWPASGTWQFANEEATAIVRDDDTVINILTLNDFALVISLSWSENTIGLGRTNSISGEHVFTFSK